MTSTSALAPYAVWLLAAWVLANAALLGAYRRGLRRIWREPVFRHPVLVLESDDWGAGPLTQAQALRDIAAVLERHHDAAGRAAVLNLALVLAVPNGHAIRTQGHYARLALDDRLFAPVLAALRDGRSRGVFALQLHGMEHFWPTTLMASRDANVRTWLTRPPPAATEELQSHLQSRWVDTAQLPSRPHTATAIRAAVAEEVQVFTRILGQPPQVVVPPTFVWTRDTEAAWADHGLACIVTPGWRYTLRDAQGMPAGDEGPIVNGDRSTRLTYLARSDYFEPARGRDAEYALRALDKAATEGRVCLLENHRDNFIGNAEQHRQSLAELDHLYREALKRHGDLRFLSSSDLGVLLRDCDPLWLVLAHRERLPFVWKRLRRSGRLWKLMVLTGAAAICALAVRWLGRSPAQLPAAGRS